MQGVPRDPRGETSLEVIRQDPRSVEEMIYTSFVILRILALSEDQSRVASGVPRSTSLALPEGYLCLQNVLYSGAP